MTLLHDRSLGTAPAPRSGPVLEVVIPVHNEEADLEASVRRLHEHLGSALPFSFRITIADNAKHRRNP